MRSQQSASDLNVAQPRTDLDYEEIKESFMTANEPEIELKAQDFKDNSYKITRNKSQLINLPLVQKVKKELSTDNPYYLKVDDQDPDSDLDNSGNSSNFDYELQKRSQSMIQLESRVNLDMLQFNQKGPKVSNNRRKESSADKKLNDSYDPKANAGVRVYKESAKEQENRIRKASPYGNLLTWKLMRIIVKSNDDIRQE